MQAVRSGGLLFVSGQPGVYPEMGEAAGPTFAAQLLLVVRNLEAILKAGDSRFDFGGEHDVIGLPYGELPVGQCGC